jgi:hypothetical protein
MLHGNNHHIYNRKLYQHRHGIFEYKVDSSIDNYEQGSQTTKIDRTQDAMNLIACKDVKYSQGYHTRRHCALHQSRAHNLRRICKRIDNNTTYSDYTWTQDAQGEYHEHLVALTKT